MQTRNPLHPHIEQFETSTGLKVLRIKNTNTPYSVVSAWLHVGARNDPSDQPGLAHFLEHVWGVITPKFKNRVAHNRAFEAAGIEFNAFTTYETTHYYHIQLNEDTKKSLELLCESMTSSILDEQVIKAEKKAVINEEAQNRQDSMAYLWRVSQQALWPESGLAGSFFGDEESLENISGVQLEKFTQEHYVPSNIRYVIVDDGALNIEEIKNIIERHHKNTGTPPPPRELSSRTRPKPYTHVSRSQDEGVSIALNYKFQSTADAKARAELDLLRSYFASGWVSLLIEQLRINHSFTYWVNGEHDYFADTSYMRFQYNATKEKAAQSIDVCLKEIEDAKTKKISDKEFSIHKKTYLTWLIKHLADPYNLLWWSGNHFTTHNQVLDTSEYMKRVQEISYEDLQRCMVDNLRDNQRSIVTIGNLTERQQDKIKELINTK